MEVRDIKLKSDMVYEEKPVAVLDRKERETCNRVVKFYKVLWSNHEEEDATWVNPWQKVCISNHVAIPW